MAAVSAAPFWEGVRGPFTVTTLEPQNKGLPTAQMQKQRSRESGDLPEVTQSWQAELDLDESSRKGPFPG